MIEYQYRGLPHAHLVVRLDNAHDIDDPNREDLISFVNRHFVAEMPRLKEKNTRMFTCRMLLQMSTKERQLKWCI